MTDLIDRQDAIRIVDSIDTWQAGWRGDAIESLKALPSAQAEERTGKRTETHACDLISRQAAIEALKEQFKRNTPIAIRAKLTVEGLPPAQPEIIRCKDCKYADDDCVCQNSMGLGIQDDDDYCSYAERRTE